MSRQSLNTDGLVGVANALISVAICGWTSQSSPLFVRLRAFGCRWEVVCELLPQTYRASVIEAERNGSADLPLEGNWLALRPWKT